MSDPNQHFLVGVKEEGGKHFACLMHPETKEIDYVTPPCESREDALANIRVEITLRHASKGEIIEIKSKKVDPSEGNT